MSQPAAEKPTTAITAAIVDDEPPARDKLRRLLTPHPDIVVRVEASRGQEAIERIAAHRPDVVFLDVQMPDLDGIAVAQRLPYDPVVVFTTAYDRYAVTAFTLHAVDYLLKPFSQARFDDTIARIRDAVARHEADGPEVRARVRRLPGAEEPLRQLFVRTGPRIVPVLLDGVVWFEARDDYVAVHEKGRTHLAAVRMNELEARLDPLQFRRVHRSAIVNLALVERFETLPDGSVQCLMRTGMRVAVSRSRARELRRECR